MLVLSCSNCYLELIKLAILLHLHLCNKFSRRVCYMKIPDLFLRRKYVDCWKCNEGITGVGDMFSSLLHRHVYSGVCAVLIFTIFRCRLVFCRLYTGIALKLGKE